MTPIDTSRGQDEAALRRAERLQQLVQVGRSLTAELDLDVLLRRVLRTGRELCGAQYAALGVLDEQRHGLSQFLTDGEQPDIHGEIGHLPRGRGVLGLLIDEPEPIRLTDISEHPRSFGFPAGHPPMRSFLGAPIVIRGEAWGNLYLTEKEGGDDFDEGDVEAIVVLAEWAAIAIDNANLFQTSERRRMELERAIGGIESARDIALALGGETDLGRVLELIANRARALVSCDALLIWLVDGEVLRVAAQAGDAAPAVGTEIPLGRSTSGATLRTGASIRVDDVASGGLIVDPADFGLDETKNALLVPLVYRGRGVGVLAAFDHIGESGRFSEDDERALGSFAASAATAVATTRSAEAQRLREAIAAAERERKRWARDLHDETLQGLGAVKLALSAAHRGKPEDIQAQLVAAMAQLEREIAALRNIISDLRPPSLDELGLVPALRSLAQRVCAAQGVALELALDAELEERRFDPDVETIAYRVAQEALTNVGKHAAAEHVRLELRCAGGSLVLVVSDDGRGSVGHPHPRGSGYGITGMRERAELGGGTLRVAARPERGTSVHLELPLSPSTP